jgi:tripartite-type tricarboxylate transporter receptor subunit TctC
MGEKMASPAPDCSRESKEAVSQLAGWFTAAIQVPDIKVKLAAQRLHPAVNCGADFATLLRKQYDDYGRVIRGSNMKAE